MLHTIFYPIKCNKVKYFDCRMLCFLLECVMQGTVELEPLSGQVLNENSHDHNGSNFGSIGQNGPSERTIKHLNRFVSISSDLYENSDVYSY